MKIFIWEGVEECTGAYHSNGGVIVFAENEKEARELALSEQDAKISDDEKPNYVRDVVGDEKKVFIFPDAGCC